MRLRLALLGSLLAALVAVAVPGFASAAPVHNRGLTINATPNPILAGEGVLIYGQLKGGDITGQRIKLYHRVNPSDHFTLIRRTTTDRFGFYEFTRAEGVVLTNRSWFVRGPDGTHSRTVHERVAALVMLAASNTNADTSQPITFFGHVTPNHAFERVFLQVQRGSSDDWKTLASTRLGPGSNYVISYRWRIPGQRIVRVLFPGDARNIMGASDPLSVTIQQHQVPDFTINSTDPVIQEGQAATIFGKLYIKGTKTPEPDTPVTLCGRVVGEQQFTCDTAGVTGSDGSYSFTVSPLHNEVYVVKTTLPPHRHSAPLLEAVRDAVTLTASSSSANAGQKVTFTGTVTPDKASDTVYLQRFGADGDWHTVAISTVRPNSQFQFVRVFGTAGAKTFRAHVLEDQQNVGGVSPAVTVTVTLPPVSSLPKGS
jgi:hypothetical protein